MFASFWPCLVTLFALSLAAPCLAAPRLKELPIAYYEAQLKPGVFVVSPEGYEYRVVTRGDILCELVRVGPCGESRFQYREAVAGWLRDKHPVKVQIDNSDPIVLWNFWANVFQ